MTQAFHTESFPTKQVSGFTPMYHPGWDHAPQTHEAGGSGLAEADAVAWAMHSSDSEGLPPPMHPRQSILDHQGWEDVNNRLKG